MSQDLLILDDGNKSMLPNHCLGSTLAPYVISKLPLGLTTFPRSRIIVKYSSDESLFQHTSNLQPKGKLFNCYRPVAQLPEDGNDGTLEIICFPGRDYVEHYATLVQTYYLLQGQELPEVAYVKPSHHDIAHSIMSSNLGLMGAVDVVVLGYVEQLSHLASSLWEWGSVGHKRTFGWQILTGPNGRRVAFVGARFSFWGDISYHLVHALCKLNGAKCIIYIGKAGSLRKQDHPNEVIATGNESFLDGEKLTWKNVLEPTIRAMHVPEINFGVHVTVRSPLDESEEWLSQWATKSDWVDCEVGWMARGCEQNGADFAYLHVISDNVAQEYEENLVNENVEPSPTKRRQLLQQAQRILQRYLHLEELQQTEP